MAAHWKKAAVGFHWSKGAFNISTMHEYPSGWRGYVLSLRGGKELGRFKTLAAAKRAVGSYDAGVLTGRHASSKNPHMLTRSWSPVHVRRLRNGKVQVRVPIRKANPLRSLYSGLVALVHSKRDAQIEARMLRASRKAGFRVKQVGDKWAVMRVRTRRRKQ